MTRRGRPPKVVTLHEVASEIRSLEATGSRINQYLVCAALGISHHVMVRRFKSWGFASWDDLVANVSEDGLGPMCPTCGCRMGQAEEVIPKDAGNNYEVRWSQYEPIEDTSRILYHPGRTLRAGEKIVDNSPT